MHALDQNNYFRLKVFLSENGFKIFLWCEYSEKYYIEMYFSYSATTDILLEANINDSCQILQTKNIIFWNNQVYPRWKPTPWSCSKNSYSAPVLKIIRKWYAYEKGNVYFKGFLATGLQYLYGRLFEHNNFLRTTFSNCLRIFDVFTTYQN